MQERLQKIIARAGIASRRHAEQLILSGQVRLNGVVVTELGTKADAATDQIEALGKIVDFNERKVYIALNKPPEVVSTLADPEGRKTLRNCLKGLPERVYPVGRLDYTAAGLVFLTNDGDLAAEMLKDWPNLQQVYHIKVKGRLMIEDLDRLGRNAGATIRTVRQPDATRGHAENFWYEVTVADSKKDVLRRVMFAEKHPVEKLKRIGLGPLNLEGLPQGRYRLLSEREVAELRTAIKTKATVRHPLPAKSEPDAESSARSTAAYQAATAFRGNKTKKFTNAPPHRYPARGDHQDFPRDERPPQRPRDHRAGNNFAAKSDNKFANKFGDSSRGEDRPPSRPPGNKFAGKFGNKFSGANRGDDRGDNRPPSRPFGNKFNDSNRGENRPPSRPTGNKFDSKFGNRFSGANRGENRGDNRGENRPPSRPFGNKFNDSNRGESRPPSRPPGNKFSSKFGNKFSGANRGEDRGENRGDNRPPSRPFGNKFNDSNRGENRPPSRPSGSKFGNRFSGVKKDDHRPSTRPPSRPPGKSFGSKGRGPSRRDDRPSTRAPGKNFGGPKRRDDSKFKSGPRPNRGPRP